MNNLKEYIIEKLHLNKDLDNDDANKTSAEVFDKFFTHMMYDMSWYPNEYEIDAKEDFVTIKFKVKPTDKDFSDTLDGINNRLKDRRMEDYMTVEYDQDKREIYIKIDKK